MLTLSGISPQRTQSQTSAAKAVTLPVKQEDTVQFSGASGRRRTAKKGLILGGVLGYVTFLMTLVGAFDTHDQRRIRSAQSDLQQFATLQKEATRSDRTVFSEGFKTRCMNLMNALSSGVASQQEVNEISRLTFNRVPEHQQAALWGFCDQAANAGSPSELRDIYDQALVQVIGPNNASGLDLETLRYASNRFFDHLSSQDNKRTAMKAVLLLSLMLAAGSAWVLKTTPKPGEKMFG